MVHGNLQHGKWLAYYNKDNTRVYLYSGVNFFEACCARKSWEAECLH